MKKPAIKLAISSINHSTLFGLDKGGNLNGSRS